MCTGVQASYGFWRYFQKFTVASQGILRASLLPRRHFGSVHLLSCLASFYWVGLPPNDSATFQQFHFYSFFPYAQQFTKHFAPVKQTTTDWLAHSQQHQFCRWLPVDPVCFIERNLHTPFFPLPWKMRETGFACQEFSAQLLFGSAPPHSYQSLPPAVLLDWALF